VLSQADALTSVVSIQTPIPNTNASDNGTPGQLDVSVVATSTATVPAVDNGTVITTTAQPVADEVTADPAVSASSNGSTDPVAVAASNGTNGASAETSAAPHPADHGDGSAG
jgi:hypothetical protein